MANKGAHENLLEKSATEGESPARHVQSFVHGMRS